MAKDWKRGERLHHDARLKQRYRRVAERWAGRGPWKVRSPATREEFVARTAARLAHHKKHDCWMCKRPRYNRRAVLSDARRELEFECAL